MEALETFLNVGSRGLFKILLSSFLATKKVRLLFIARLYMCRYTETCPKKLKVNRSATKKEVI